MENVAQSLVSVGVVRLNFDEPFTWTSGIKSPIYCDCRELISVPVVRDLIVDTFVTQIREQKLNPDYIAGPATAGIPWAAFIAQQLDLPMLYVRKASKGHGAGKQVEGRVNIENPKIVVVEDAFSTGGSSIKSAQALRDELGADVTDILGIFSWGLGVADQNAAEAEVNLRPLTQFTEIVEALQSAGQIDEAQQAQLVDFQAGL